MRDTEWLARCGWGIIGHYLTDGKTTAEEWNRQVDSFQVEALADTLEAVGAGYFMLAVGQCSGHYCAPNETYDRISGIKPSKCSRRDLISDLYEALEARGIPLLAYIAANGPVLDSTAREPFKITASWDLEGDSPYPIGPHWSKWHMPEFFALWQEVSREWSLRWGAKVRGWWVDGTYAQEYRYPETDPANLRTYAEALRAGNPEAIVALSAARDIGAIQLFHYTDYGDFTAGETWLALPEIPGPFITGPSGHKDRSHVIAYLGNDWFTGEPRFPDALVCGYTEHIISKGGAVTWDVPVSANGSFPESFIRQLTAIGKHISKRTHE